MTEYKFDTKKAIEAIDEFSEYIIEHGDEYYAAEVIHILMSAQARLAVMADNVAEAEAAAKKVERYAVGPSETKKKGK